jgi:hypothetical protein
MKAYTYNEVGELTGEVNCQPDPLAFGMFLVPARATTVAPPRPRKGKMRIWNGKKWIFRDIPTDSGDTPTDSGVEQ